MRLVGLLLFAIGITTFAALNRDGAEDGWVRWLSLALFGPGALMFLAMIARVAILREPAVYISHGRLRWVSLFYVGNLQLSDIGEVITDGYPGTLTLRTASGQVKFITTSILVGGKRGLANRLRAAMEPALPG